MVQKRPLPSSVSTTEASRPNRPQDTIAAVLRRGYGLLLAWFVLVAFFAFVGPACAHSEQPVDATKPARFGILAFRPKPETLARWQPLVKHLNDSGLSRRVELEVFTYAELEAAVREKRVDFVLTQPAHYAVLAHREALHSPLASLLEEEAGQVLASFGGVILALANRDDIRELKDLRGKRISLTSRQSLGAYLAQAVELREVGIELPHDARLIESSAQQDHAFDALLAGTADAAFVRTGVFETLARAGRIDAKHFKVIRAEKTPDYPLALSTRLYPQWALAAMPWADSEFARELAATVLGLPHGGKVARAAKIHGFAVPGNYQLVTNTMRALRMPPFDQAEFQFADAWERYRWLINLLAVAFTLVVVLALRLNHFRRAQKGLVERLNEAQRIAKVGHWELDVRTGHLTWSDEVFRIYGIDPRRFEGKAETFFSAVHPDDRAAVKAAFESSLGLSRPYSVEHRIVLPDGSIKHVAEQCEHIRDAKGRPLRSMGTVQDITARKDAERALAQSEEAQRTLIEALPDVIMRFDVAHRHLFSSTNIEALTGIPASNFVGRTHRELGFPESLCLVWDAAIGRVFSTGQAEEVEFNIATLKGERTFNWRLMPDLGTAGQVVTVLGIARDITESQRAELALRESESHYRSLFEGSSIVMLLIDPQHGRIRDANAAAARYYGYAPETLRSMAIGEINTLSRDDIRREMDRANNEGRTNFEFRHRLSSGEVRDVLVSSGPIRVGGEDLLLSTVLDVTDRHVAEQKMRQALAVFNASNQGIITTDPSGRITNVNPAFTRITGYEPDEVLGRTPSILRSGRHDKAFYEAMWAELSKHGTWEGEIWNRRKGGQIYPEWLTISSVRDAAGQVVEHVALFSDITERKQHEEDIWRKANFDALTGLANRNLFADRLERSIAQARRNEKRVGVAFLDLDGFKWINDTLGHDVGDELLVEIAQRLRIAVRDQDTVARLGGDEFTVVIHDLDGPEDMLSVAAKLVEILREPMTIGGSMHQISGSVGITLYPDDGEDVQTLLKNADIAMYKAKQAGKNRYQFYARHMQVDAQARVRMEADLRVAIETGAFMLHYQPIVDADSGELVGAEALLRWQHPERGVVSPLDFIPVAEDCGLIIPIGEWVLHEAARQWHSWRRRGHSALRMSVNVSSVQFRDAGLRDTVAGLLREFEITPGCLVLEITESVLMDGSAEAEARMRDIKALGVAYSLDDFGTGFSSLSYLKRFPVDVVKIDRSFVNDCPEDRNDAHLVEAIVNMAHSLGLRVTAEGVETEAQLEFLRDLGCDTVQGYLIGRPLPPESFETLIERRQILLATDGASAEEARLLAALRDNELDVEGWLERLLGEHDPDRATYALNEVVVLLGLNLRQAIEAHLDWRRRLDDLVGGRVKDGEGMGVDEAGSHERCALGQWINRHEAKDAACFRHLDEVHRAFHRMAGQIVEDYRYGHRGLARRTLSGSALRKASRDVIVALIDCYRSLRGNATS